MRELLVIAVTALVSAAAGAFIGVSFTDAPDGSLVQSETDRDTDVDELRQRIAVLEQQLASRATLTPVEEAQAVPLEEGRADSPTSRPETFGPETRATRIAGIQQQRQSRIETRLRDAGWTDDEIAAIDRAQEQAALDMEQKSYESMRRQLEDNPEAISMWQGQRSPLRASLGDDKYEEYLEAIGRPVAAEIHNVLAGSAGAAAGLQPGDQIRSYGSERVFNEGDLWMAIASAAPGESVSVEVERDGAIFHVTVPAGPLGASNMGRAFYGRP